MVLFNQIVEVFHLPQFTAFGNDARYFEFIECFGIGSVFVDVDHTWFIGMRGSERFEQEAGGCLCISGWAEKEIERVSLGVNCTVEIYPLLFHFDVCLINPPGVPRHLQLRAAPPFKFRRIMLNPSIDRRMIDMQSSLHHHFLKVTVAQRITEIPPHTQENTVGLEVAPFERILL
jgi:hypothetical protein